MHLNEKVAGPASAAVAALLSQLDGAGVERGVLLHLAHQRWTFEDVAAAALPHAARLLVCANIKPGAGAAAKLRKAAKIGARGLKLHPRLERYPLSRATALVREAGKLGMPVVIDAFPDGDWLMRGFEPLDFAALAKACPKTRIVAAHMGGHRVLDFMMLAKRVPNLYLDCSYALLYYRTSSVPADMIYAMRSLRFQRVFYGSDYPDRPADVTLRESLQLLRGVEPEQLDRLLYRNAEEFFPWTT